METVEYKNISFTVWDVGGQDKVHFLSLALNHHSVFFLLYITFLKLLSMSMISSLSITSTNVSCEPSFMYHVNFKTVYLQFISMSSV